MTAIGCPLLFSSDLWVDVGIDPYELCRYLKILILFI